MLFHVDVDRTPTRTVVRVVGDLDLATAPQLRQHVMGAVGGGSALLVLDLRDVDFCDSTGLGVLLGAQRRVNERLGRLVVVASPSLLQLLSGLRLDLVFEVIEDLAELDPQPSGP